ncbi:hypothetical protein CEXT_559881 [Caerostris extrusa]|uniref:Uncharacterized protein n=1 Tax=Caerostris extrusa TaxID=172846 RepID=A0AAV4NT20_CAEEX|nr:hypothetical protein CEXT_559881 [Caerostris extrusa]
MGRKTSLHRREGVRRCAPPLPEVSVGNFHLIAADRTEFPVGSGKPGYESAGSVGKSCIRVGGGGGGGGFSGDTPALRVTFTKWPKKSHSPSLPIGQFDHPSFLD